MEILIGRGGNQGMVISDSGVSKIHCRLEVFDSGMMALTNLSPKGTWLNGIRLAKRTVVKPDDEVRLGSTFTVKVKDLLVQENYSAYTSYLYVSERYKSRADLEAFILTASRLSASEMPAYVMPVVRTTMAYYDIMDGNLYNAQQTLYDVGDQLYEMQDGTELLQGIYASVLGLVGLLYTEAGRYAEAQQAVDSAATIFGRIAPDMLSSTPQQRQAVADLQEKINSVTGTKKINNYGTI